MIPMMLQAAVVKKKEGDLEVQDILIVMEHMIQAVMNMLITLQVPGQGSYQQGGQQCTNQCHRGNQYNNQNQAPADPTMQMCCFCNKVRHNIKSCPEVEHLIGENKCQRNEYGMAATLNRSYIPNLTGVCMHNNIKEYYS